MGIEDFTIMHISDLHKGEDCNYDQLLDSMIIDKISYSSIGIPPIRFIVICGDLVEGSRSDDLNVANKEIESQYNEVEDFLNKLVVNFLDGNKDRIIIVPGNHDINWCVSKKSMSPIANPRLVKDAKEACLHTPQKYDNQYRWDWGNLQFMKIDNNELYETRLDKFAEFYDRFYKDKNYEYPKKREEEAIYREFEDFNISFACFNSNCRLDHLNPMGLIHNSSIHSIFTDLLNAHRKGRLIFGVWHHHIYGYPYTNNYLDRAIVQSLGTNHIKVGLFGHQHMSEVVEELKDIANDENEKMLLLSSGTLFGDKVNMLAGIKRQYNLISVKMLNGEAILTIRTREDITGDSTYPKWKFAHFSNGKDFVNYNITLEKVNLNDSIIDINKEIMQNRNFKEGFITMKRNKKNPIALKFSDKYIQELSVIDDADFIIENIIEPETAIEYVYLLEAFMAKDDKDALTRLWLDPKYKNSDNVMVVKVRKLALKKINTRSWKK